MRDFEEQYGVQTLESAGEGEGGGWGYSLQWPIRGGFVRKGYLFIGFIKKVEKKVQGNFKDSAFTAGK